MTHRIATLEAFWPFYLSEHRSPLSRKLHFVGTTWFLGTLGAGILWSPMVFPLVLCLVVALGAIAVRVERSRPAFGPMLAMVLIAAAASPWTVPVGILGAYAMAWVGHFRVEGNRPATFTYPIWSLVSDLRMWGHMMRGRLWDGDPLDALDLQWEPDAPPEGS